LKCVGVDDEGHFVTMYVQDQIKVPGSSKLEPICSLFDAERLVEKYSESPSPLGQCLALTAARELSAAASDATDPGRHREYEYLRSEPAARSATAKPRTAESELDVQGLCFQLSHVRKKGAADQLAARQGKKYKVKISTNDLWALVQPAALGGATKNTCMDMLHVADLGVTPKLAQCELALITRSYALEVDGYKRDRLFHGH
jgi:hypothetical protein